MGKGNNVHRMKIKEKRWKEINTSKVVEVRLFNLDLGLLWKYPKMKLGDYKRL
jgi:hypothetical protein